MMWREVEREGYLVNLLSSMGARGGGEGLSTRKRIRIPTYIHIRSSKYHTIHPSIHQSIHPCMLACLHPLYI